MATLRLATATRNALADALSSLMDTADGPGTISIYAGEQPSNANVAVEKRFLLGELTCSQPAADRAISGTLSFNAIKEEESAVSSDKATWARLADSHGNVIFDCDVTGPGGGGTIELNTTDIVAGGNIRIRGFTITFPAG